MCHSRLVIQRACARRPDERRCATRCGAAANDRDGDWRDRTAAPGCGNGVPTPHGVRAAA
eukprot:621534-Prymnesium_polylepis.1